MLFREHFHQPREYLPQPEIKINAEGEVVVEEQPEDDNYWSVVQEMKSQR